MTTCTLCGTWFDPAAAIATCPRCCELLAAKMAAENAENAPLLRLGPGGDYTKTVTEDNFGRVIDELC